MIVFGIDPGVSGALSIYQYKKLKEVIDMPTMSEGKKNKKQINAAQLTLEIRNRINELQDTAVVIEHVTAMPGQGVTSMFNFGQSFGVIKGICSALTLPIYFVRPVKWKKHFNLIGSSKDASRTKAIELFPNFSNDMAKKKDANKADAILIGRYFLDHYNNNGFHG
ncbi:MAG: crossover junction endodeoxyribonuclease [Candidatus Pelagibacter sp.]|nr:crossover junction endodeoxyribonuclease [Candidatus Pelagibacter sp.]MAK12199.1 crossover junction endodeoxyribonuclease [Candidatus Pelagibacter sp.]